MFLVGICLWLFVCAGPLSSQLSDENLIINNHVMNQQLNNASAEKLVTNEDTILSFGEYADKVESQHKPVAQSHENVVADKKNPPNNPGGDPNSLGSQPPSNGDMKHDTAPSTEPQKKQSRPAATTTKLRSNYNYASSSCGATVISHSRRVKHSSEMLIDNPDTYALFPCINNKSNPLWFIIQLCEPINIHSIYLSNLELFSSHIKTFRIALTNVELAPTDSQWHQLESNFTLNDGVRSQMFSLENSTVASNIYARYVRVEVVEHHNMDYFCPISVFKVYGVSLVDELSGGPSIDDDSPTYSGGDNSLFDEPSSVINNLYDLYQLYEVGDYVDGVFYSVSITANYVVKQLINLATLLNSKSPTLRFFYRLIMSVLRRMMPIVRYLVWAVEELGSELFGVDIHFFDHSLVANITSTICNDTGVGDDWNTSSTSVVNSKQSNDANGKCALLFCSQKLLGQPSNQNLCCTTDDVDYDHSAAGHDCSVCRRSKNKYGLATTNHNPMYSCILDDFCDYYCRNNSSWTLATGIVPFNQYYATNEPSYENRSANADETVVDSIALNQTGNNGSLADANSASPQQLKNNTHTDTFHSSTISNATITNDNETASPPNSTATADTKPPSSTNSENEPTINASEQHRGENSTTPQPIPVEGFDSNVTISTGETSQQSSTSMPQSTGGDTTADIPKLKDMIGGRDDSHLGYISRIRKNLTITMKYLDDMSVKFKRALDEVKKQVFKAAEESNDRLSSVTHQYNHILSLHSIYNSSVVHLRDEIAKIKNEFTHRRGIYVNLSLFDCAIIVVYVAIFTFVYKLCRHVCLLLFLTLLKWQRIRKVVECVWNFYWRCVYPSTEYSFPRKETPLKHYSDLQVGDGVYGRRHHGAASHRLPTPFPMCRYYSDDVNNFPNGGKGEKETPSETKYFSFNSVPHDYYPLRENDRATRFHSEYQMYIEPQASNIASVRSNGFFCPKCSSTKLSAASLDTTNNNGSANYKSEHTSPSSNSLSSAGSSVANNTFHRDKESDHLASISAVKNEPITTQPHEPPINAPK